ncbi:hypothetical protein [Bacillus sp. SM2101]|uniref:hypothetical protein n=1 Tax=Bacillus sp. SM2101 TaxID=2805366 RepID=UPI001BDE7B95|nr:hypothetical protein [Bacillus sp. SM2101]
MKKYLGWVSLGLIIITSTFLLLFRGNENISGQLGINILLIGFSLTIITAFLSPKGIPKILAFIILGLLFAGFVYGVLIMVV